MTIEEAIKKGYLENKIVYLKPSPRKGKMVGSDNEHHVAYFMYDGATKNFVLPKEKNRKVLVNPFKSVEERKFFEEYLDLDLNPYKEPSQNFWVSFRVKFTKTRKTLKNGLKLDLSDPLDNLRYRVLRAYDDTIAPTWEQRFDKPRYEFAFVDSDYEEQKAGSLLTELEEVFTFYGSIKNSPKKLKEFLEVYYMSTKQMKGVEELASKEWLQKEVSSIIENNRAKFLDVARDPDYETKLFIHKGIKAAAIEKSGINSYKIAGDSTKWTLEELVRYIKQLKEVTDDTYLKIEAQIKLNV